MNKKINELKTEKSIEERKKSLLEALDLVEELKKITDEAYQRKQNENNRNNSTKHR